jgi:hypothetical protein
MPARELVLVIFIIKARLPKRSSTAVTMTAIPSSTVRENGPWSGSVFHPHRDVDQAGMRLRDLAAQIIGIPPRMAAPVRQDSHKISHISSLIASN